MVLLTWVVTSAVDPAEKRPTTMSGKLSVPITQPNIGSMGAFAPPPRSDFISAQSPTSSTYTILVLLVYAVLIVAFTFVPVATCCSVTLYPICFFQLIHGLITVASREV